MKQEPFNPMPDGTCRTIKANYQRQSLANFLRGGGTEQQPSPSCRIAGQIWRSKQNGKVYDPDGLSPCICVGHHAGVEPKIIGYDDD